MTTVSDLKPGEVVLGATFVAQTEHPLYRTLRMVVWKMPNGEWMHDALDARQDVGQPDPSDHDERLKNLRRALLHRSQR